MAAEFDKSQPLSTEEMEVAARQLLAEMELGEGYVGWTMVVLASEFWRDQVAAVPPRRRLFLVPQRMEHLDSCAGECDRLRLDGKRCGACCMAEFQSKAEVLGYQVLVTEGSPLVLQTILSGSVDAIVGVSCLNVLEKAIDKILLAGIPCMAVPLLSNDCNGMSVDEDWVEEMIRLSQGGSGVRTRTYLHLMRAADRLFSPEELERIAPRLRQGPSLSQVNGQGLGGLEPIAATEAIAYDFLTKGGKHSRPFITLAAYDALTGAKGTQADGARHLRSLPDAIRRTALSIETFHKASLVHDDVEDDDAFRYGDPTLHRKFGTATAINVGDYLIGLGYRLVSREAATLGPDVVSDILDCLADAHMKLSEGQGAELVWRDARDKSLKPSDALAIYALKTAPAFEAALYSGLRLAGPAEQYLEPVKQLAKNLGVAFQILNDLKDWHGDENNKRASGGDVFGGRPTVLWALALESLSDEDRADMVSLIDCDVADRETLLRVRQLYMSAGVFETAGQLVDDYQKRAEDIAKGFQPGDLRRLLYYLIDTVLERPAEPVSAIVSTSLQTELSVAAKS
ncbi:MAG: polyprenyl synthetase family protein [Pirellulales bacterium]